VTVRPTVENAHAATALAVLGLAVNVAAALAAPGHTAVREAFVLAFAGLGPGTALVAHLRRLDAVTAVALTGLTSLTVAVAGTLPAGRPVPSPVLALVAAGCALSCLVALCGPLAVRLFANMFAGHILIAVFTIATWYLFQAGIGLLFSATSFVLTIALTMFELLIQVLQAYIFTILTAQYIGGAWEAAH